MDDGWMDVNRLMARQMLDIINRQMDRQIDVNRQIAGWMLDIVKRWVDGWMM